MASGHNDNRLTTCPLQHAGGTVLELPKQLQTIDQSVVERSRVQEHQLPRQSARLEASHQDQLLLVDSHGSESSARREKRTQQQKPVSQKRLRTQNDPTSPEESSNERRKRRQGSAEMNTSALASPGNLGEEEQRPIAYWAANKQWPRQFLEQGKAMENILARKRPISARSMKTSDTDTATPSSIDQGEPKLREQKSAGYTMLQYETVLATKGFSMKPSPQGVTTTSKDWCKGLLEQEHKYPEDTLFRDDLFDHTCDIIHDRNKTRVIREIALLIVPSAEIFAVLGATHLEPLIDSVNEGWNNSIPITKTRPRPDYAVGFRREAFTQDQLDRMHPVIGDFDDQSYFMATWYMYFPFLTCEVKGGTAALDIADRQNAHSAAIAVRAVVELFRAVKREKELHREILAFSISHDSRNVRIYGYYAEIADSGTKYYRHRIREFSFIDQDGREKWTAYKFTKNVYDNWMPMHFKRICSAIDQIPAGISFSVSQSELRFSETPSGLSQDLSAHNIAQSSVGATSANAQDVTQLSIDREPVATPGTTLTDRESKRQRRESF